MLVKQRAGLLGFLGILAIGMMLSTTPAFGAYMNVNNAPGAELSVLEILLQVTNFGGIAIQGAERMDDALDDTFNQGITSVTYICSMWGQKSRTEGTLAHTFGYSLDGGANVQVINTATDDPNDSFTNIAAPPDNALVKRADANVIRFYSDNVKYDPASSDDAANVALRSGAMDRVLTFNVTAYEDVLEGLDGSGITTEDNGNNLYLMFFDTGRDGDYNDLVILVEDDAGPNPGPPEPASGVLLAIGTAALLRRKINR